MVFFFAAGGTNMVLLARGSAGGICYPCGTAKRMCLNDTRIGQGLRDLSALGTYIHHPAPARTPLRVYLIHLPHYNVMTADWRCVGGGGGRGAV